MPGEQSIASGACEATPKLALPPSPSPFLRTVSLCLGINCGLLKCFLIEILPNFTLGDQVQPVRSLCYANTLTLWRPAPSRHEERERGVGTANNNKQGSFCVSGQNAGAQQQQQGERTRTSGKAEKKVKAVKTSKVTGKASSAANVAVASSSRRQHIINFNVARESPTAATATASAAASVANSSLNPGLGLGLRLLPLFIHNFNSTPTPSSPLPLPSCLARSLFTTLLLLLLSARLV